MGNFKIRIFIFLLLVFTQVYCKTGAEESRFSDNFTILILIAFAVFTIFLIIISIRYRIVLKQKKNLKQQVEGKIEELNKKNEDLRIQKDALEYHHSNFEKIISERTADLEEAKKQAEESDRLKTSFLANMSHEIRTPMNAILGFVSLLEEEGITGKERQEFIDVIEKNSDILLNLIEDIIDIAKIEAGQMRLAIEECSLSNLLDTLYIEYTEKLKLNNNNHITIEKNISEDEGILVRTDIRRVQQIVTNLMENALKFTSKGTIEIGLGYLENEAEIYVKDTGIGIEPQYHSFVFERFTKIEKDPKQLYRGTGLGLFITKKIVENLGGTISLESNIGEGSTFKIVLPVEYVNEKEIKLARKKKEMPVLDLNDRKVLIVDDEPSNIKLLKKYLDKTNAKFLTAKNGKDAIEVFIENTGIDLILMDIKMPVMDGIKATHEIRNINKSVIIIAQTAYAMSSDKDKIMQEGCNDYIAKPIAKEKLFMLLAKYF